MCEYEAADPLEFEVEEYHPEGVIWRSAEGLLIGTLSSQDGNAEEDFDWKINFCLYLEFKKWLHVFTVSYGATPQLQHNV